MMSKTIMYKNPAEIMKEIQQLEYRVAELKKLLPSNIPYYTLPQCHIEVYSKQKILYLPYDEIVCIQGIGNYSTIYTKSMPPILTVKTLKFWQERLLDSIFKRVHKSYLINSTYITSIEKSKNTIFLDSNIRVRYSKSFSPKDLLAS